MTVWRRTFLTTSLSRILCLVITAVLNIPVQSFEIVLQLSDPHNSSMYEWNPPLQNSEPGNTTGGPADGTIDAVNNPTCKTSPVISPKKTQYLVDL